MNRSDIPSRYPASAARLARTRCKPTKCTALTQPTAEKTTNSAQNYTGTSSKRESEPQSLPFCAVLFIPKHQTASPSSQTVSKSPRRADHGARSHAPASPWHPLRMLHSPDAAGGVFFFADGPTPTFRIGQVARKRGTQRPKFILAGGGFCQKGWDYPAGGFVFPLGAVVRSGRRLVSGMDFGRREELGRVCWVWGGRLGGG